MSTPTNDENQNVPQSAPTPASTPGDQPTERFARPVPPPPADHPQSSPTQPLPPFGQQPSPQAAPEPAPVQPQRPQPQYGQYAPPAAAQPAPQPAAPHAPAAYGQQAPHNPYAPGAAFGMPGVAEPAAQPAPAPVQRKPRTWVPVTVAAVVAALLASGGTAALTGAFDSNTTPSSIASIGQQSSGEQSIPVSGSTSSNPNWEKVTSTVSPSVVAISVTLSNGEAEGSGVILDKTGHVLTNNHVVSGAQNDTVQVTLNDGRIYQAKVVGTDPTTDLAVVKLQDPPSNLAPATLGDSSDVTVGQAVLAVGNPLGLANTATTGIVSAVNRPVTTTAENSTDSVVTNAIQIDAAVNPGNSGGPLFDAQGRVIGITSSIASLSGSGSGGDAESGSIGLGFAIPINVGKLISTQLIAKGTAQHALLGVTLTDATATADGVTRAGAKVTDVTAGSPAANAGVKVGDVIVAIDGQSTPGADSLTGFVRAHSAGDAVKLTLVRGSSSQDVTVTLAVRQETTTQQQGGTGQGGQQGQEGQQGQGGQGFGGGQGEQGQQGQGGQGFGGGDQGQQGGSDQQQQGGSDDENPFGWFFGGGN